MKVAELFEANAVKRAHVFLTKDLFPGRASLDATAKKLGVKIVVKGAGDKDLPGFDVFVSGQEDAVADFMLAHGLAKGTSKKKALDFVRSSVMEGKAVKMTAAQASAHYEKLKGWLEKGLNNVTQRMVDGAKATADSLWNSEFKASEKNLIDKHGADWWELAKKQYPVKQQGNVWVVRSNFALDPDAGKRGPWEFDSQWQAMDKVVQLVKWLDGGRKKGYGDKDADVQNWFNKLDKLDLSKKGDK